MDESATSQLVALLFSDLVCSMAMKERLGDEAYLRMLARHNSIFKSVIAGIAGADLIKSTGDGFLTRFTSASKAVEAALLFQWALAHEPWATEPLRARAGVHVGEVVEVEGVNGECDLAGLTVDMTARIMGLALPGQILLTRAALDAARPFVREHPPMDALLSPLTGDGPNVKSPRLDVEWLAHGLYLFQGHQEPLEIFEVGAENIAPLAAPIDCEKARRFLGTPAPPAHNLRRYLSSFVGRSRELVTLKQLLRETRLLTLTGVGGCGKTRLALRLARDLLDSYADGVWLVELAATFEPGLIAQQLRSALNLAEQPGQTVSETVINHLRDKQALLLLDNCEHLLEACAMLADELLRACPKLRLLATSQERLGIEGETTYVVPSLSLPADSATSAAADLAGSEAVTLFVERARAAKPGFSLTDANAAAVARICRRFDGIPLVIEFAAAKIPALTPDEIASRLDESFRILTGGNRTALPRHQTLRAGFDWSYQLLTPKCKTLLQRLSVFAGGWSLEGAESVCSDNSATSNTDVIPETDVLPLLITLVNRSLVISEETADGRSRYRLQESVRQFAGENLTEAGGGESVHDRHLDFFLTLAQRSEPELQGAQQKTWLDRLEEEYNNLLAALRWCGADSNYTEQALNLSGSLWRFWDLHGHYAVGRAQLTAAINESGAVATEALAKALNAAGYLAGLQGDYEAANELSERSLRIRQTLGDTDAVGRSLRALGVVAQAVGKYRKAQLLFRKALAIHREAGARGWESGVLSNLGELEVQRGDYASARSLSLEALDISREINNPTWIARSLKNLADVAAHQQDYNLAKMLHAECMALRRDLLEKHGIADSLEAISQLATSVREEQRAARLLGAAERLREEIGSPLRPCDQDRYQLMKAATKAALAPIAFEALWSQGRAMSWEQAVEETLAWLTGS